MTKNEYIKFQDTWPGKQPPCCGCSDINFDECKDQELECAAFRDFIEYNYHKPKKVGVKKHPFKTR